jgi:hypothetical protein
MKKIQIIAISIFLLLSFNTIFSQNINWKNLKEEDKHILNINAGWEYSFAYGIGYGYHLKAKIPIIIEATYSFPSGETIFDDFKTTIGGQINVYRTTHFYFNTSFYGSYRRTENPLAVLQNFGSTINTTIGYYKPKWFIAGEVDFDKAIITSFDHSDIYKEVYPDVKNGWYEPTTGGNFRYGIQTGYSFNCSDLILKIGKVTTQDFKTSPLIPFYTQIEYSYKLN